MTAPAGQGKRLGTRVGIGLTLIAAVIGTVLVDQDSKFPRVAAWVAAALALGALYEYAVMVSAGSPRKGPFGAMLLGGALIVLIRPVTFLFGIDCGVMGPLAAAVVAATLVGLVSVFSHRKREVTPEAFQDVSRALVGLLVVPLPLAMLVEIGCLGSPFLLLFALFTSKLNDMGGYLIGIALGRTKLCPGVSPHKSVEGAIGGMFFACLGAYLASQHLKAISSLGLSLTQVLVFAVVVSIATMAGDLFESLIKRAVHVKDSARLLPAFGGLFDLVDSFIFAAPAGYTLLRAWLAP